VTAVLIYHDIVDPEAGDAVGFPGRLAGRYKHTPEAFERHLDAIAATGRRVGLVGSGADVALTFDDGGSAAAAIAERLEHRGWRGHFFVTTERIGTPGFADADTLRALATAGHDVGSHSHTHPTYMGRLPAADIRREWIVSRERLGDVLGTPPATASVPGGYLSNAVVTEAARAGYVLLMTSQPIQRNRHQGSLTIQGRYTIWGDTPASTAAAYARGAHGARTRLWVEWTLKDAAKRASPRGYEWLRRLRAGGA
jgi:peptidoglycan/xylan/chitin deacetylase (PgdA/CDA1 family)